MLEPYKLLADVVTEKADSLGDSDMIEMLNMFTELDQSYEGFRACRASRESSLGSRDTNRIIKQALESGMNI